MFATPKDELPRFGPLKIFFLYLLLLHASEMYVFYVILSHLFRMSLGFHAHLMLLVVFPVLAMLVRNRYLTLLGFNLLRVIL